MSSFNLKCSQTQRFVGAEGTLLSGTCHTWLRSIGHSQKQNYYIKLLVGDVAWTSCLDWIPFFVFLIMHLQIQNPTSETLLVPNILEKKWYFSIIICSPTWKGAVTLCLDGAVVGVASFGMLKRRLWVRTKIVLSYLAKDRRTFWASVGH